MLTTARFATSTSRRSTRADAEQANLGCLWRRCTSVTNLLDFNSWSRYNGARLILVYIAFSAAWFGSGGALQAHRGVGVCRCGLVRRDRVGSRRDSQSGHRTMAADVAKAAAAAPGAGRSAAGVAVTVAVAALAIAASVVFWQQGTAPPNPMGQLAVVASERARTSPTAYAERLMKKYRARKDYRAAMQLGRLYALQLIESNKGSELPDDEELLRLAQQWFDEAAKLGSDQCEPLLSRALLHFVIGDDKAAKRLLRKVAEFASPACKAESDLYNGYVLEFDGDAPNAKAKFSSAREELPSIHENFYSRVYAHTDPVIPAPKYEKRLRLLSAYRDFYHGFYADRNQSSAREFNPSHVMASGVDIRGGTLNLDNANDVLNKNDFVVLRAFLTPWETRTVQALYADLIDDKTIDNFDENLSRTITYNDRISHWLGQRYTDAVNGIVGEPVKHVYSFLCWHSPGPNPHNRPVLKPHIDREDNEFTISIQLHYVNTEGDPSWPIWVHVPTQEDTRAGWKDKPPRSESVEVRMLDGDAILFRGRRHVHWRDEMPVSGLSFSSLLLHYVHEHFDWRDFKYVRQAQDPAI